MKINIKKDNSVKFTPITVGLSFIIETKGELQEFQKIFAEISNSNSPDLDNYPTVQSLIEEITKDL